MTHESTQSTSFTRKGFFFSCSDPQIIMSMLKIHLEANNINSAIQVIISNAPIET